LDVRTSRNTPRGLYFYFYFYFVYRFLGSALISLAGTKISLADKGSES